MARNENPPFPRGSTWYGGDTPSASDLGGVALEGMEWVFEDVNPDTGVKRTSRPVRCRIVRNVSGANLLPKRLVQFDTTAGKYGVNISYMPSTTAEEGYPLDEYLPAAGVVDDDLCWIVIEGPAVCITSLSDMGADIGVGNYVVAITAATSGATTAGRVTSRDLTGSSAATDYAFLASQVENRIGRALTARTTTGTNADILVDVGKW